MPKYIFGRVDVEVRSGLMAPLLVAEGKPISVYIDSAGATPATGLVDFLTDLPITQLQVDKNSQIPLFYLEEDLLDVLWVRVGASANLTPIYARTDERLDALEEEIDTKETPEGAQAKADAAVQQVADQIENGTGPVGAAVESKVSEDAADRTTAIGSAFVSSYARVPVINVTDYGAVGDDSTTNDVALANAFAAAVASGRGIYFPPGAYRTTSELDWRGDLLTVVGEPNRSIIKQMVNNTPIMHVGGARVSVRGLYMRYNATQVAANTNAVALKISDSTRSRFEDLEFYKTYNSIAIPQAVWRGTQNCVYSCIFENISSNVASGFHIDLNPYLGGNTGSVLSNIYMKNLDGVGKTAGLGGIRLKVASEMVLRQINVEHGGYVAPLQFESVDGCTIDGVHFEGVQPDVCGASANNNAFFNVTSSQIDVRNATWYNNILDASLGITLYAQFRINGVSKILAAGLKESSTILNAAPSWRRLYVPLAASAGSTARFRQTTKSSGLPDFIAAGAETSAPIVIEDSRRIAQPVLSVGADLPVAATVGYAYMPRVQGTPTGTPVTETGGVPFAIDTTNNRIWVWNGSAWKFASLT